MCQYNAVLPKTMLNKNEVFLKMLEENQFYPLTLCMSHHFKDVSKHFCSVINSIYSCLL